ncbi:unnamed protein product [Lupinus luteus]|uniref:Uncharacterized protein n=1 Tax=Lupinus luteus TaxID=3873 RepID=A0AAV1XE11_LUPLU
METIVGYSPDKSQNMVLRALENHIESPDLDIGVVTQQELGESHYSSKGHCCLVRVRTQAVDATRNLKLLKINISISLSMKYLAASVSVQIDFHLMYTR